MNKRDDVIESLNRQDVALRRMKMETKDCINAAKMFRSSERHWRNRGYDDRARRAAELAYSWEIAARQRRAEV